MVHDSYEDHIDDPGCLRMRAASGCVNDDRKLVSFLYTLMRDHLVSGGVEKIMSDIEKAELEGVYSCSFTNGWLAHHAQDLAARLGKPEMSKQLAFDAVVRTLEANEGVRISDMTNAIVSALGF